MPRVPARVDLVVRGEELQVKFVKHVNILEVNHTSDIGYRQTDLFVRKSRMKGGE